MGIADTDTSSPGEGDLKMSSDYPQESYAEPTSPRKPQPPKANQAQMARAAAAACCLLVTLILIVCLTARLVEPIFHREQLASARIACVPEPYKAQKGDSLKSIAAAHPEHGVDWMQLCSDNGLKHCEELEVGTELTLSCSNQSNATNSSGRKSGSRPATNPYMQTTKLPLPLQKAMADAKAASAAASGPESGPHGVSRVPALSAEHTRATAVVASETARATAAAARATAAAVRAKEAGAKAAAISNASHASHGPGAAPQAAAPARKTNEAHALTPGSDGHAGGVGIS